MKLKELFTILQEASTKNGTSLALICGGVPRDRYLNHLENISDIDLTTGDKTVEFLSEVFYDELKKKFNIKRIVSSDGHSTIFIGNLKFDFSSNFNVEGIDSYLSKIGIKNPTDMQKEMFSRDFTCNALLLSLDLKTLTDPTNHGCKDLDNKIIKTCLAPEITLTTNRNRVVRAIYLACKLDFSIDPSIINYVKSKPESVNISTNKVMSEKLNEAFTKDADKASFYLTKMGLWNYIPITKSIYPYYIKSIKNVK